MKIVSSVLNNHFGGPQIRLLNVAGYVKKKNIEYILTVLKEKGEFVKSANQKQV